MAMAYYSNSDSESSVEMFSSDSDDEEILWNIWLAQGKFPESRCGRIIIGMMKNFTGDFVYRKRQ
jgi:hypothetical protein